MVSTTTASLPLASAPALQRLAVESLPGQHALVLPAIPQWRLIHVQYLGWALLGDQRQDLHPGYTLILPPGASGELHGRAWDQRHVLAEFLPTGSDGAREVPLVLPLGPWSEFIANRCAAALACWTSTPPRANARFWDLLFQVAEAHHEEPPQAPLLLDAARAWIEARLGEPIGPGQVAEAVGVSRGHLLRLFRLYEHTTIAGFIRRRRVRRAQHLLMQSDLPICDIARSLGIPDLQAFNKAMRRELGAPPSKLRAES